MNCVVIIPARFDSKRLPGKPLADINGKPMILHVLKCAIKSKVGRVIVATDHKNIIKVVQSVGVETCLTKSDHHSGTERVAEVINHYNLSDDTIIINLQGDQPFLPSSMIHKVADNLINNNQSAMTTLAAPILDYKEALNPNVVKIVTDSKSYALYFSRMLVPWCHNYNAFTNLIKMNYKFLKHIGIYAYKAGFIRNYIIWKSCNLEHIEKLEQLRILWYGKKVHVGIVNNQINNFSIDTVEDLKKINKITLNDK